MSSTKPDAVSARLETPASAVADPNVPLTDAELDHVSGGGTKAAVKPKNDGQTYLQVDMKEVFITGVN